MILSDRLITTILGGLIVWVVTMIAAHFIKRSKIRAALLADIAIHQGGIREQSDAVNKLVEDHLIEGLTIPFPIFYNVGEYLLYKALQKNLPDFLSKAEIVKVVKFYQALWEMDVSINVLASILGKWEKDKVVLSKEQIAHAKKRRERINSYCQILAGKDIQNLADLPDDYRAIKGAETVIART